MDDLERAFGRVVVWGIGCGCLDIWVVYVVGFVGWVIGFSKSYGFMILVGDVDFGGLGFVCLCGL